MRESIFNYTQALEKLPKGLHKINNFKVVPAAKTSMKLQMENLILSF